MEVRALPHISIHAVVFIVVTVTSGLRTLGKILSAFHLLSAAQREKDNHTHSPLTPPVEEFSGPVRVVSFVFW